MAHILIVEDAAFSRRMLKRVLQEQGHEVIEAENGKEALAILVRQTPDCIIADLLMPEMGGIELLQVLRHMQTKIPVVILTADVQETSQKMCLELGAIAVLNKPVQGAEVQQALSLALNPPQEPV